MSENIIDTRDLQTELDELEALDELEEGEEPGGEDDPMTLEERERMNVLRDLRDEIGSEWSSGAALINEDHFVEYAQDFAEDIGAIPQGAGWPLYCIDWERAARELKQDYTSVMLGDDTYYVRLG